MSEDRVTGQAGIIARPWAVIMARGQSRRMGRPKGCVPVPGRDLTMLQAVCRLYPAQAFRRLVVTLPDLVEIYQPLLAAPQDRADLTWIIAPCGGTTAGTLQAVMDHEAGEAGKGAREADPLVLAHPVDLPLVRPATRDLLVATLLRARAGLADGPGVGAVRPEFRGCPGHPVVFARSFLCSLLSGPPAVERERATMGELLRRHGAAGVLSLPIDDPGVVQDFDTPEDLGADIPELL